MLEEYKKRLYNDRVMQIKQGTFTPLVFTTTGSMGPECLQYHKSLAEKISNKSGDRYSGSDVLHQVQAQLHVCQVLPVMSARK